MSGDGEADLERQIGKLRKINRALMERVERSMDLQGNAFSMSQTAIILEQRVRERTQALEEAMGKLEDARSVAELANLSKTRFLAAASHDLLQPLSAARLFTAALAERRQSPANHELTRRILASLDSVESILTSLLDISRLEAGVLPVSLREFPVAELFSVLEAEFAIAALRRQIVLRWVASSGAVKSDPRLLARIVRNYISNALRYTPAGGRVLVGCRRRGDDVMIGVWDTGRGIPADKLEEIFEEFHRLPGGPEGGAEGTEPGLGLGLTIVKRMAETLGHPLVVRSRVGCGSLFGVVVPVSAGAGAAGDSGPVTPLPAAVAVLRGARIVVIDNDAEVLAGLCLLLQAWQCRPIAAASGAKALERLAEAGERPDLIIADYQLDPGENGVAAAQAICARMGGPIPTLVISAHSSTEMTEQVHRAGCQFLAKPLQKGPLRSLLAHLLKDRLAAG